MYVADANNNNNNNNNCIEGVKPIDALNLGPALASRLSSSPAPGITARCKTKKNQETSNVGHRRPLTDQRSTRRLVAISLIQNQLLAVVFSC